MPSHRGQHAIPHQDVLVTAQHRHRGAANLRPPGIRATQQTRRQRRPGRDLLASWPRVDVGSHNLTPHRVPHGLADRTGTDVGPSRLAHRVRADRLPAHVPFVLVPERWLASSIMCTAPCTVILILDPFSRGDPQLQLRQCALHGTPADITSEQAHRAHSLPEQMHWSIHPPAAVAAWRGCPPPINRYGTCQTSSGRSQAPGSPWTSSAKTGTRPPRPARSTHCPILMPTSTQPPPGCVGVDSTGCRWIGWCWCSPC